MGKKTTTVVLFSWQMNEGEIKYGFLREGV